MYGGDGALSEETSDEVECPLTTLAPPLTRLHNSLLLVKVHQCLIHQPILPTFSCLKAGVSTSGVSAGINSSFKEDEAMMVSWSVLGHILSEEQSKDGSDGVSDDGRLTIVQCHLYHRPSLSDLYWSSIGILPLLRYHQQNLHSYHCHYQPAPCAIYRSTTRASPCSTHISRMHQFSRS